MQRMPFIGVLAFLSMVLTFGLGETARGQDRGGAAGAAVGQPPPAPPPGAAVQPQPAPPGAVVQPPVVPPGGPAQPPTVPVGPPMAGNIGIGAIPVTPPPPIGYYARPVASDYNMGRFFYYPYYYYPHNYWPTQTCRWPERPGEAYVRPPAYMAYPPFMEPHWRYEWYTPQRFYRGFHFWLDQF